MTYAKSTEVSVERSKAEIEQVLTRYGADQFAYGWNGERAMIQFRAQGRLIRFVLDLPDRASEQFWYTPSRRERRSADAATKAWEQACRSRWRALLLVVKAKLEAVEAGIAEFEAEFLAHVVLPDGTTVGDWMAPQIEEAYSTGAMPSALPALESGR